MAAERVERRLSAIFVADVAGYSRLMGADEEGTHARLNEHLSALVYPEIEEHGGRIIRSAGDGILVEFASVVNAMRCAVAIQRGMITELSRFSGLFVIARNSSFRYKGKAVDLRQVGRELGVRYALEGSVRRGGDRVRINAQLTDAGTGIHRWAERYDQELEDVFAIQDNV